MRHREDLPPALRPPSDDPVPRIALRPTEAAKAIGVCERFLRDLGRDGPPFAEVGTLRLYPTASLEAWIVALATTKAETSTDADEAA
jgi:hypothetical protein